MNYDRVRSSDRLQNNSMLPFHATNKKLAFTMPGWQLEPIGKKLALEFFVKFIYATPLVLFISPAFLFFNMSHWALKRLDLIN